MGGEAEMPLCGGCSPEMKRSTDQVSEFSFPQYEVQNFPFSLFFIAPIFKLSTK